MDEIDQQFESNENVYAPDGIQMAVDVEQEREFASDQEINYDNEKEDSESEQSVVGSNYESDVLGSNSESEQDEFANDNESEVILNLLSPAKKTKKNEGNTLKR